MASPFLSNFTLMLQTSVAFSVINVATVSGHVEIGQDFVNCLTCIHCLQAIGLKVFLLWIRRIYLLKVLSPSSRLLIHVWYKVSICFSDNTHSRGILGVDLFQGSVSRRNVIGIETDLDILIKVQVISFLVSIQDSLVLWDNLVLILIISQPGSANLFDDCHCFSRNTAIP